MRGKIQAVVFDFDGVLVESVDIKTRAFACLFSSEAPAAVERILDYHLKNGGISRQEKFRTIYRDILKRPLKDRDFGCLCRRFAELVVKEVTAAPWVKGAEEFLRTQHRRYRFFIISGTPEKELKFIIRRRGIQKLFRGVFGSPRTKDFLLKEILKRYHLRPRQLVFVGDAPTDWRAAQRAGVPFIWRRVSPVELKLPGFSGFAIPTLARLAACLSKLEKILAND
ncbi:MAG: HAD family hydrolase [Elusimicrobia bacterium]|nr:HAD family hydrolase [Elusimicrobiota bacterium]